MKGESGAPILSDVIFTKIENSYAFIADITFCSEDKDNNKYPNPNVLIELGYASRALGWDRIILIINEVFGDIKNLPVDISDRRHPFTYNLPENSEPNIFECEFNKLIGYLKVAIKTTKEAELLSVRAIIEKMDQNCQNDLNDFLKYSGLNFENDKSILKLSEIEVNLETVNPRLFDLDLVYFDSSLKESGSLKLTTKGKLVLKTINPNLEMRSGGRVFFV
jgi:hypothetical protein